VHLFEEFVGEPGPLDPPRRGLDVAALRSREEPAEDELGAAVGAAQVPVGIDDELSVLRGARPGGEVLEVLLVPDLPGADRMFGQQRVFGPEAAPGAVAEDGEAKEFAPGGA